MHNQAVHHHKHQRKRVNLQKQDYPHPNKKVRLLDKTCLVFSVLMPATTIPQIWRIFKYQEVEGYLYLCGFFMLLE